MNDSLQYWLKSAGLIVLLTVGEVLGFLNPIRAFAEKLLLPEERIGVTVVSVARLPYTIALRNVRTYRHVQDLELRYAEALAQLSQLDQLKSENQALRAQLNNNGPATMSAIIAPILSYGQPTIGVGSEKGVAEGDLVFVHETLIGTVGQTSANEAEVLLLVHGSGTAVLAKTESGVVGTLSGDGRHVVLQELPVELNVNVGERVMTAGQPGVPAGLSVGRITAVQKQQDSPVQQAMIDQLVSFYDAQFVEVRRQ